MEMDNEAKIALLWHAQHAEDRLKWARNAIAAEKGTIVADAARVLASNHPSQLECVGIATALGTLSRRISEADSLATAALAARAMLGQLGLRGMLTSAATGESIREATLAEVMRDVTMRENGEDSINEPPIFDVAHEGAQVGVYVDFSDREW